jgi:hypothetical protein
MLHSLCCCRLIWYSARSSLGGGSAKFSLGICLGRLRRRAEPLYFPANAAHNPPLKTRLASGARALD